MKMGLRTYYWVREHVLFRLPLVGRSVSALTELAAETLIASWRDSFLRKPFYIPSQATTWVRERGVTPAFEASLMRWRRKLFDTVTAGLVFLIASGRGRECGGAGSGGADPPGQAPGGRTATPAARRRRFVRGRVIPRVTAVNYPPA